LDFAGKDPGAWANESFVDVVRLDGTGDDEVEMLFRAQKAINKSAICRINLELWKCVD